MLKEGDDTSRSGASKPPERDFYAVRIPGSHDCARASARQPPAVRNYLLHAYCGDLAAGKSHGNGQVFDIFSRNYTVAELEAGNLWTRMDAKITGFGGCAHVP